jgi:hypothetical protein
VDARVIEMDGVIVGYGRTWHIPSGIRLERVYLSGVIDPGHRNTVAWEGHCWTGRSHEPPRS